MPVMQCPPGQPPGFPEAAQWRFEAARSYQFTNQRYYRNLLNEERPFFRHFVTAIKAGAQILQESPPITSIVSEDCSARWVSLVFRYALDPEAKIPFYGMPPRWWLHRHSLSMELGHETNPKLPGLREQLKRKLGTRTLILKEHTSRGSMLSIVDQTLSSIMGEFKPHITWLTFDINRKRYAAGSGPDLRTLPGSKQYSVGTVASDNPRLNLVSNSNVPFAQRDWKLHHESWSLRDCFLFDRSVSGELLPGQIVGSRMLARRFALHLLVHLSREEPMEYARIEDLWAQLRTRSPGSGV